MRHPTLVALAGGGLAAALALGAAVPALASGATSSTTATATPTSTSATPNRASLSGADLVTIDRFFENHPVLGHQLAARIEVWKTFLDKHPQFAAKLQEWKALPPKQRRIELHAWLIEHPAVRRDLSQVRAEQHQLLKDLRQLRRDLRSGSDSPAS
jgi:hemophore-related protein